MTYGIQFKQGDILLVPFPFSNLEGMKQRPVLVLSKDAYNLAHDDIITCGITSNLLNRDHSVLLSNQDLVNGALPKTSQIKVDKLFTLEKKIVKRKLGKIRKDIFSSVKEEFLRLV